MSRYHVRVIPSNGKPALYLIQKPTDFHDGPFTDNFAARLTFARPHGAERRIAIERDRLPNRYYGDITFVVVEEADETTCHHCGAAIRNEAQKNGLSCWVDETGGDICGWGGGGEPHEPA